MIAIVDYDAGNVRSVINALRRLGVTEWTLTADPSKLREADKVLLPGVGDASVAIGSLRSCGLDTVIKTLEKPVLGICVGMQALCRHSEEGDTDCIGVFDVDVRRFRPTRHEDKVPAMGWNSLTDVCSPLYKGIGDGEYVYFVHSFYVPVCDWTIAKADYTLPYSASLHKDNFYTCQFHPEKSGAVGEKILSNFLSI